MKTDTIAAIATGMGNSGIGIIRISGAESLQVIDKIFQSKSGKKVLSKEKSHTIHYGFIMDQEDIIDEVMVLLMKGPKSYTCEDVVEINCHGGIIVTRKILETVIKYGARPANPGEFTKRAFLNGRIDLSQAEAVIDVICAKNEMALKSSIDQLKGSIKERIVAIRKEMILDIAFIEAALDDPEHISVEGFGKELLIRVDQMIEKLNYLLVSAESGRIIKEGIKTVILGKPNVGKSSLLNVLVGEERAIVTNIAGTTRDTLEESIQLGNIILNLVDTAGIRDTEDLIETIGVKKAKEFSEKADLIIFVVDASRELDRNDDKIINLIKGKKAIILLNKIDLKGMVTKDLLQKKTNQEVIEVSVKNQEGIELLEKRIHEMFFKSELNFNSEVYITNVRHKYALEEGIRSLMQVKESIKNEMPEDFYTIDLMNAYEVLGEIIGESVGEDLVNTIFSEFCMGK